MLSCLCDDEEENGFNVSVFSQIFQLLSYAEILKLWPAYHVQLSKWFVVTAKSYIVEVHEIKIILLYKMSIKSFLDFRHLFSDITSIEKAFVYYFICAIQSVLCLLPENGQVIVCFLPRVVQHLLILHSVRGMLN